MRQFIAWKGQCTKMECLEDELVLLKVCPQPMRESEDVINLRMPHLYLAVTSVSGDTDIHHCYQQTFATPIVTPATNSSIRIFVQQSTSDNHLPPWKTFQKTIRVGSRVDLACENVLTCAAARTTNPCKRWSENVHPCPHSNTSMWPATSITMVVIMTSLQCSPTAAIQSNCLVVMMPLDQSDC